MIELPKDRIQLKGLAEATTVELLACLVRTGTRDKTPLDIGESLMAAYPTLIELEQAGVGGLEKTPGVGKAKALQILAGLELGRRLVTEPKWVRPVVRSPDDAAELLLEEMRLFQQEHFVCLYLNTKNEVISKKTLFIGGLNTSIVHPRDIFREAIRCSAASFIAVHNHPSGDPTPSREDIEVSERMVEAGRFIGISCIDHIIIGHGQFISMKQRGFM
ncbi:RadC family protein [Exiguobacterium flavidum]|uniref:RadC family protein n=1 Tax=Exiguobacterium flavidum TaxID=2184695 RepID=UPI000DF72D72|nr:DNA repair protein RadC [Exiguobacterium flavidum]